MSSSKQQDSVHDEIIQDDGSSVAREESGGKQMSDTPSLDSIGQLQQVQVDPKQMIERMADNDSLQNRRLSASVNGLASASSTDLYKSGRHQRRPSWMRFVVCTLGLLSLSTSQMSRMILNFSITQMVDRSMPSQSSNERPTDGSCPWPEESASDMSLDTGFSTLVPPASTIFEPLDGEETNETTTLAGEFLTEDDLMTTVGPPPGATGTKPDHDRFEWTMRDQQTLLGGFYYSYFVFMILGGRMAEMYGAKYVLMLSVAGSALISLATPWMARNSFLLLVMSRVVMGAIQSGVFPGMYALINKWLTMNEASIYAPLVKMNLRLGSVLASSMAGAIDGWPNVFYATGAVSAVWSVLWLFVATSDPADNRWVSPEELAHIHRKKQPTKQVKDLEQNSNIELEGKSISDNSKGKDKSDSVAESKPEKSSTPWTKIITSPSVIGLIIVKLTFNYAMDFLSILLPSYLDYVHHLSKEKLSGITTPMFLIQVVLIVFVGWLTKITIQRRPCNMSKTTIRKLFQGVASFGLAASLFLFTFNNCNILLVALLLQLASFLSIFTAGGETMLPYDLSSQYPATIMAIANSIANVSAVTTTAMAGFILAGQSGSYDRWNLLIYLIAGANVVGGLAFTLLVSAEPIDFSSKKHSKANSNSKSKLQTATQSQIQTRAKN